MGITFCTKGPKNGVVAGKLNRRVGMLGVVGIQAKFRSPVMEKPVNDGTKLQMKHFHLISLVIRIIIIAGIQERGFSRHLFSGFLIFILVGRC